MPVPLGTLIDVLSVIVPAVFSTPALSIGMIVVAVPPPFGIGVVPEPRVYACSVRRSVVSAS